MKLKLPAPTSWKNTEHLVDDPATRAEVEMHVVELRARLNRSGDFVFEFNPSSSDEQSRQGFATSTPRAPWAERIVRDVPVLDVTFNDKKRDAV